jgi:hypothetical protein
MPDTFDRSDPAFFSVWALVAYSSKIRKGVNCAFHRSPSSGGITWLQAEWHLHAAPQVLGHANHGRISKLERRSEETASGIAWLTPELVREFFRRKRAQPDVSAGFVVVILVFHVNGDAAEGPNRCTTLIVNSSRLDG